MTSASCLSRRLFASAGSGVLGIAVLGTLAACQSSTPSAGNTSSVAGSPSTTGASDTATTALTWKQVSLSFVSAYLLIRGGEVAIVDTGTAGSKTAIESALKAAGSGWNAVRHVILTHRHPDHVGGLAGVAPLVKATLYAGEDDAGAIASSQPLSPVKDGDEVFGLRIISTPGHTVGHVSVFDASTAVLVAGDALRNTGGLQGSDPQYTASMSDANASVKKLAALDVKVILPGHGAPLTSGASEALRQLATSL